METFYLTFGTRYARETHPSWPGAHPDGWVEIHAPDYDTARRYAMAAFGVNWCWLYETLRDMEPELFARGRIAVLDATGIHEEVAP